MSTYHLPLHQRLKLFFLSEHQIGPRFGNKQVAQLINCDVKTLRYWRARWKETKDLSDELKSDRNLSITAAVDEMILNETEENDDATGVSIARDLKRKKWKQAPKQFNDV